MSLLPTPTGDYTISACGTIELPLPLPRCLSFLLPASPILLSSSNASPWCLYYCLYFLLLSMPVPPVSVLLPISHAPWVHLVPTPTSAYTVGACITGIYATIDLPCALGSSHSCSTGACTIGAYIIADIPCPMGCLSFSLPLLPRPLPSSHTQWCPHAYIAASPSCSS